MIYEYQFTGYPAYQQYREKIKELITKATKDSELNFYIAVNEAVCNAARYGAKGILETEIEIKLKIEADALQTRVFSQTQTFDAARFRRQLQELAQDDLISGLDWYDWVHQADHGRGIWLMLAACDFICLDKDGQFVTLHTPLPFHEQIVKSQIGHLVSRFFIDDRGLIL